MRNLPKTQALVQVITDLIFAVDARYYGMNTIISGYINKRMEQKFAYPLSLK